MTVELRWGRQRWQEKEGDDKCLAIPAKIVEKEDQLAMVEINGIQRKISTMLLPTAELGDFVLVHAGFAMQLIEEEEAKKTEEALREMGILDDEND